MVYTADLKSADREVMPVRVRPGAPKLDTSPKYAVRHESGLVEKVLDDPLLIKWRGTAPRTWAS